MSCSSSSRPTRRRSRRPVASAPSVLNRNRLHSPAVAAGAGKAAAAPPPDAAAPSASATAPNSRQRRSAARSARRHAARRAQSLSRSMLALLFIVRLRRLVDGTLGLPGGPADAGASSGSAKRGPDERPSSGCSSSSSSSRSSDSEMRMVTPGDFFAYSSLPRGASQQKNQIFFYKRNRLKICMRI